FDRMHACGVCHVLIDNFADADGGCFGAFAAEPVADGVQQRGFGLAAIDADLATSKALRIDLADDEVGIGHRCLATTAPVTGGTRLRPGAVGSNQDALQAVDACDRAAAGANLHHFDDWDAHGHAAALLESRLPVPLQSPYL